MQNISWIGVIAGALALFALAGVWYTVLFGKAYREELGVPEPASGDAPQPPPIKALAGQFVAGLVIAFALAWFVGEASAGRGALDGLLAALLVAAVLGQFYLFEGRTLRHLAINVGYIVLGLTAAGAILGAFQAA